MDFLRSPFRILRSTVLAACALTAVAAPSCAPTDGTTYNLHSDPNGDASTAKVVRLTLLHTSDIHSRLFPYQYTPLLPDTQAGLQAGNGPYGGVARVAYILNRERANADRVMHLNGGDMFEGAPVFNYFNGEAEMRALAQLQTDAMVIANHEFDKGAFTVFNAIQKWADFPVLAANYSMTDPSVSGMSPLGAVLQPYTIRDVRGLRVAIIGMGNLSTVTSIFDKPNRLGIMPWDTVDIVQYYVDLLRPRADLIVLLTHLGLEEDQRLIQNTEGVDIVLGGHNHIVISPPQELFDCGGVDQDLAYVTVGGGPTGDTPTQRPCHPRRVLLMHSGAFAKFVGRLDLDVTDSPAAIVQSYTNGYGVEHYDSVNGFEVVSHTNQVIPIDNTIPDDIPMDTLLEPYKEALVNIGNLDLLVGYAPAIVKRTAPSSGDSALGNLIATSMWQRLGVQSDMAMTNTTGIRADLPQGPVTVEQLFNVFPFDNTITKMQLSGHEIVDMFDYAARRSQTRSCVSQIQIAGSFVAMNCNGCDPAYRPDVGAGATACAEQIFMGYTTQTCQQDSDCESDPKLQRFNCDQKVNLCRFSVIRYSTAADGTFSVAAPGTYALATSNYLAGGGSGFITL
ncbi:MAG: bifunctional metallophosphatase/5'-nucleotidase, partial [Polyangiales bacterium]